MRTDHKNKPKLTHQKFKKNRDIVRSSKSQADPGKDLTELLGFSVLRVTKVKEKKPLRDRRADARDYLDMVLQLRFISLVFGDADDIGPAAGQQGRHGQKFTRLLDSVFTAELEQMPIRGEVKEIQLLEKLKRSVSIILELCLSLDVH